MQSVGGMLLLKVWKSNIRQHSLLWLAIKLFDYITHPVLINCYWCLLTDIGKSHQIISDSLKVILTSSKLVCCVMWWCVVSYGGMLCGILLYFTACVLLPQLVQGRRRRRRHDKVTIWCC